MDIFEENTYVSAGQINLLMTSKSITTGFPKDLREAYRLLLRYPLIWFTIIGGVASAGFWAGNIFSKLDSNEAILKSQEEAKAIRTEERERCDKAMEDYKEFVNKWIPKGVKNEK